jgi:hypothetical protein
LPRRWITPAAIAIVLAVYAALAFHFLPDTVVYSGDMGIKFVQARALLDNRFTSLVMPYRGAFLDPDSAFTPFRAPFILKTPAGVQAIFPPAGAILEALFVWAGGLYGMRLLSILGAALAIWCATRLADPGDRPWIAVLLGLGTPLWFYGVTEWEHAPAVGLGTAAFLAALRLPRRGAVAAGLLLGLAAALRDECGLLLPGLMFACWLTGGWKGAARAAAACVLVLAANAAMDVYWFGRPAAAHLQHAVHLLREDTSAGQPALAPLSTRERYQAVFEYWLVGVPGWRTIALAVAALTAGVLAHRRTRGAVSFVLWTVAIVAAVDAAGFVAAPKFLAGMYRNSPFLLCAVLPAIAAGRVPIRRVALVTSGLFLLVAFLTTDTMGGKAMGARLLLPLLPLLAVPAVSAIRQRLTAPDGWLRATAAAGLVLAAASIAIQVGSTMPAWVRRSQAQARDVALMMDYGSGIFVVDDMYTAQGLLPLYYRRIIMLAAGPEQGAALGRALDRQRMPDAIVISRSLTPNVVLPPYEPVSTAMRGGLLVQLWRR